jgi:hypothetical protein
MDGQLIIVVLIVCLAAVYLVRRMWLTWSGRGKSCSKGCGCGKPDRSKPALISSDELTLRVRNARSEERLHEGSR